jgi:hypothetical protein
MVLFLVREYAYEKYLGKISSNNVKMCVLNFWIMVEYQEQNSSKGHMHNERIFSFNPTLIATCKACEIVYVFHVY